MLLITFCKGCALHGLLTTSASCGGSGEAIKGHSVLTKILRVVQITATILLIFSLHVTAKSVSQTITLSGKNIPLKTVFAEIEKQSGYLVVSNKELIDDAKPVSINVTDYPLLQFLDETLTPQGLGYVIENKTIFLKKQEQKISIYNKEKNPPVSGIIRGPDGQPLSGVNVMIKGTKKGTVTDKDGRFSIDAEEGSILEITSVGYGKKEIRTINGSELVIALDIASSVLDEIQYIAYGQTSRRLNVGNIGTVKAADIEKQPVSNPLLALEGRVPGLFITQSTGVSNGAVDVRIQGQNSVNGGLDPFIVIDGVPYPSQLENTLLDGGLLGRNGGSPLSFINPADIESVDILKDADATAIYGSRAANGAILITTKKGKVGKARIDLNIQQGWGKTTNKMDMFNTRQYLDMRYEAFHNDGIDWKDPSVSANDLKEWDTTRYTDWQKTLIGNTAKYSNINASISGGTAALQYIVGGTWRRETSVFPGDFSDRKGSVHFNLNGATSNEKLHFQLSGNYLVDDNHLPATDLTNYAVWTEPVAPPLYNSDGTLNWAPNSAGQSTWTNPLIYQLYTDYSNTTKNLLGNATLAYSILPNLILSGSFGYTNLESHIFIPGPISANRPEDRPYTSRYANYGDRTASSWIIEPQLTYSTRVWKGKIEGLLGTTIQENSSKQLSLFGEGYSSDLLLKDITSATSVSVVNSANTIYKYTALYGRLTYNWQDKYILNLNGRRDGSSRFGDENKFHNFGSIGGAWIFSNETFFEQNVPFISFGKIRASYGTTGNDQIPDYIYLSLYGPVYAGVPYQNIAALSVFRITNPYIQWEVTKKLQIGFELGVLNDRILFNGSYTRNRSSNLLLGYQLPTVTGFSNIFTNFPATIQNTSWEFSLNTTNFRKKNFTWTSYLNLTIPKNELTEFPDLASSSYANNLVIGEPVSVIKAFHFLGVDPVTGEYQFADSHGKPTITPDGLTDQTELISTLPEFYGGIQNTITFKGFQLDFLFQFVKQKGFNYIYNNGNSLIPGQFFPEASNQPVTVMDRWRNPGDNASIMRYNSDGSLSSFYNVLSSDAVYQDASYIRLENVSVSWNMPDKWITKAHLANCKLYVQGQNLATISKYKGIDPENQSVYNLAPLRMLSVGIQAGF